MNLDNKSRKELIDIINNRNREISELQAKYDELLSKSEYLDLNKLQESFRELDEQKKVMNNLISQLRIARAEMIDNMSEITTKVINLKENIDRYNKF